MPAREEVALSDLAPWLASLGQELSRLSWSRPLKAAAVLWEADTKERFETSTDPDGVPWAALRRPRANSKGGDKPLRDKGLLMAAATGRGAGHVERLTDASLEVGVNLDYAGAQNDGATIRFPERTRKPPAKPWVFPGPGGVPVFTRKIKAHAVTIPRRQFVGLSEKFLRHLEQLLADEVERQLGFDPRAPSAGP